MNTAHSQVFGVKGFLPIVINANGVRAEAVVTLNAGAHIHSSRSQFGHLCGLAKAMAAHAAETGQKIKIFSAPPPSRPELIGLTGLAKAIMAHQLEQPQNPNK